MNAETRLASALLIGLLCCPELDAGEAAKEFKGTLGENDPADAVFKKPHKVHSVDLEAGKAFVVDLSSDDFDALLRIESPDGQTVAIDDDGGSGLNSRATVAAVQKGAYRIIASSLEGSGAYTLKLRPVPAPLAVRGKLTKAIDSHAVKLTPGTRYVVTLASKDFDTFLHIENSKGEKLDDNDDLDVELLNSQLEFVPIHEDTYKLVVTSFDGDGRGAYDISVVAADKAAVPMALMGSVVKDKLTANEPRDDFQRKSPHKLFVRKLSAGKLYTFEMDSDDFDAFLRLEGAGGQDLSFDDDGGGGVNSRITFIPKESGDYRIIATSLGGGTGAFELRVQQAKLKETVLNEKGELKQKSATHRLKAAAGKQYLIDLTSGAFDSMVAVNEPNGNQVAQNDDGGENLNARLAFTARADGVFEIIVSSFDGDGRGAYNLVVREAEAEKE